MYADRVKHVLIVSGDPRDVRQLVSVFVSFGPFPGIIPAWWAVPSDRVTIFCLVAVFGPWCCLPALAMVSTLPGRFMLSSVGNSSGLVHICILSAFGGLLLGLLLVWSMVCCW